MAILSEVCKPDNSELHNSLKLSFTNIWGLRLNFVDCDSSLESNSPDILSLYETNLDDSIDSGNFSVRGYLPLIQKDSSTHMHGLAVCVKEGLSPSSSLCMVFDSISSNIDEVLLINPSANVFVFGDFNVIIRTGLPILVELIDLVYSVIIFLSQMTLLKWLTFLLGSQTVMVLLFFILTSYASIFSTMAFPPLGNSDHVVVSVSIDFTSKLSTGYPISSHSLWLSFCWLGWSSWSFERCFIRGHL